MSGGGTNKEALFSAAVLKMSMMRRGHCDDPGFRVVYMGTIADLGVTDEQVNAYIEKHQDILLEHIEQKKPDPGGH